MFAWSLVDSFFSSFFLLCWYSFCQYGYKRWCYFFFCVFMLNSMICYDFRLQCWRYFTWTERSERAQPHEFQTNKWQKKAHTFFMQIKSSQFVLATCFAFAYTWKRHIDMFSVHCSLSIVSINCLAITRFDNYSVVVMRSTDRSLFLYAQFCV